jgi:hypothetical protein
MCIDGKLARQYSAREADVIRVDIATGSTFHLPGQVQRQTELLCGWPTPLWKGRLRAFSAS